MKTYHLEIMTLDGPVFSGEAEELIIRATSGDLAILAGHIDCIAAVGTGKCKLVADGKTRLAAASGGFLTVKDGEARLFTNTFEFADDIDVERAQAAKAKAEEKLRAKDDGKAEKLAKAKLARSLARISVAESLGRK